MAVQKQLGQQTNPTTDAQIYQPPANIEATNLVLTVCETAGTADTTIQVTQDHDGTTFSAATALYWDYAISANNTIRIAIGPMNNSAGEISVKCSATGVTFTLHGTETKIS